MNKIVHIDLFSGIGGFAIATEDVWGKDVEHIFCDIDPFCREVLKKRFPRSRVYGDIRELTLERVASDSKYNGLDEAKEPRKDSGTQQEGKTGEKLSGYELKGTDSIRTENFGGETNGRIQEGRDASDTDSNGLSRQKSGDTEEQTLLRSSRSSERLRGKDGEDKSRITVREGNVTDSNIGGLEGAEEKGQACVNAVGEDIGTLSRRRSSSDSECLGREEGTGEGMQQEQQEPEGQKLNNSDGEGYFILTGGFPCQPFSQAGKRKGTEDNRYLWHEMLRVIQEFQPKWVIAENVRGIFTISRGMVFEQVCSDLARNDYEMQSFVIPAVAVNAPHRRDRVWFVARKRDSSNTKSQDSREQGRESDPRREDVGGWETEIRTESTRQTDDVADSECTDRGTEQGQGEPKGEARGKSFEDNDIDVADSEGEFGDTRGYTIREKESNPRSGEPHQYEDGEDDPNPKEPRLEGYRRMQQRLSKFPISWEDSWVEIATELCGVSDGLPVELDGFKLSKSKHRVERLKALGNAIVPAVAEQIMKGIKYAENNYTGEEPEGVSHEEKWW
jgi:DNA (cytosine-5)-methyltransferase 1